MLELDEELPEDVEEEDEDEEFPSAMSIDSLETDPKSLTSCKQKRKQRNSKARRPAK